MTITTKGELELVVQGAFEPFLGVDELAAFLADLGVDGLRHETGSCPLANMLTSMMDGRPVMVGHTDVVTYDESGHHVEVALPYVAQSFVYRFDAGHYPYLVGDDDEDTDEDE